MSASSGYKNQALRLLVKRADRQLSLTIGLPDYATTDGTISPIRGELEMIRAGLHCACADLYGVLSEGDAAEEKRTATRFLRLVAPGLLADKPRIEAYLAEQEGA